MSIVIPAGHLAHTVITVRCDSPHSAPHIECALDEQSPFGIASPEHPKSPGTFASDGRPTASSSTAFASSLSALGAPQADLSVERGIDQRGHFVRFSFLPSHRTRPSYGSRPLEIPEASYLSFGSGLSGPAPNMSSEQIIPSRTAASNPPPSMGGSALAYTSTPIMNNAPQPHAAREADSACLENMNFMSSSDADLMTAFDSFLGIFDPNADFPMLDGGVPGGIAPHTLNQPSEPSSPQISSSSSSSCGSSSPLTPCDFFLPATTPTSDGGRNDVCNMVEISSVQSNSDRSLQQSPVLSQLAPGPDPKGTPSGKSESRLLPCPQPGCKRQFKSTSTLGGHLKTHAGKGIRFQCSFPPCTEKFSRRHDQLRHEVYKHGKRCEWVCARCNSFFSYERSLEKHVCTMDKSRRGSMPVPVAASDGGPTSGAGR